MKKNISLLALRLISKKKQHILLARALNYLLKDSDLSYFNDISFEIRLRDTSLNWLLTYDKMQFIPSDYKQNPVITIFFNFNDIINFPSQQVLCNKIKNGDIEIIADKQYQNLVLQLLNSLDQLKITACIRHLRKIVGLKNREIKDKALNQLTIRDVGNEADIDYIRDQAIAHEESDPQLAYHLMALAHGARPNGPFIKRKLEFYRQNGFSYQRCSIENEIKAIEIIKSEVAYFPLPKAACTSIKLALYQLENGVNYDNKKYQMHVHDYWTRKLRPLNDYSRKVIIIRDPIERFLSAYSNRVLDHGELNRNAIKNDCPWLLNKLPHFKPNIDQFIRYFEYYRLVPVIEHHCQPLVSYINNDLSQFTDIFPLEQIKEFESFISNITNVELTLSKAHVGKNKITLANLTEEHLDILFELFNEDYKLLEPWYSKENLIKKWKLANYDNSVATGL